MSGHIETSIDRQTTREGRDRRDIAEKRAQTSHEAFKVGTMKTKTNISHLSSHNRCASAARGVARNATIRKRRGNDNAVDVGGAGAASFTRTDCPGQVSLAAVARNSIAIRKTCFARQVSTAPGQANCAHTIRRHATHIVTTTAVAVVIPHILLAAIREDSVAICESRPVATHSASAVDASGDSVTSATTSTTPSTEPSSRRLRAQVAARTAVL